MGEVRNTAGFSNASATTLWPLVGRAPELAFLRDRFDGTRAGCLVSGEAGVGKTRLLREVAHTWESDRGAVEWVIGTSAAKSISLGATAQLVRPAPGISELHELLHETVGTLELRSDDQPVALLFVDDAHFLDDASAVLVHLIATRSRIPTFVSVRSDLPTSDPIVALWKDGILPRLDVQPLDQSGTFELLSSAVDGLNPATKTRLWELSQGNALFLHELVALAIDDTVAAGLDDALAISWRSGPATRLRELIDARMGMLPPELFDTLELIAVSEPLPVVLAERLTSTSALEELERRALIAVAQQGGIRTAHPLHGEAIRGAMGALRRRSVLRRLATAVGRSDRVDAIRVATWRLEAGDRDSELFAWAAKEALRRLDHLLAERLARAVIEENDPADAIGAGLSLAEALMGQGRVLEADEVLRILRPVDDEDRARIATTRATNLFRGLGRQDEGISVLEDAEAQIADAAWLAECRSVRAMLLLICLRTDAALSIAEPLVESADIREPARLRAVFAASSAWMHRGDTERALELTATWLTRTRAWRRFAPLVEVQLGFVRFYTLLLAGRVLDARRYAEAGFELDRPHPPPALRAVFAMARGAAAVAQGSAPDALEALEEAAGGLPGSDWFYNQEILRHALVVRATLLAGDFDRARTLADADAGAGAGSDLVELYERPMSYAWLEAADGRISKAVTGLVEAAARARPFSPLLAAGLYREVGGLGHGEVVLAAAARLAEEVQHPHVALCHAHLGALVEGNGASLRTVAGQFEEAGNWLWAAETYSQAAGAFAAIGRGGAALGARERSARLRAGVGEPHSPALALATNRAGDQLTRREREIAFLAARGTSNADMAAELHVSVHTVHTHLTRIYRKLGVADRQELAGHLGGIR